jgi:hypothetical protein
VLDHPGVSLVDHGAGKSYLGFILYDLFFKAATMVRTSTASRRAKSWCSARRNWRRKLPRHVVPAPVGGRVHRIDPAAAADRRRHGLHACNTATDDAIHFALKKKAKLMVLVPCCQAEVASVLKKNKGKSWARCADGNLAPPAAHARVRQPDHQRAALPAAGSARLPGQRDGTGGLGTFDEE